MARKIVAPRTNVTISLLAVIIGTFCVQPPWATAAFRYWDVNGPSVGAGGPNPAGTWSVFVPTWTIDPAGGSLTTSWVANDVAVFSAGNDATGTFNVTVGDNQEAAGIVFEEGNVTIDGLCILTLTGEAVVEVTIPTGSATILANVSGTDGLKKIGPGRLTLQGSNLFSGETLVNEGLLVVNSAIFGHVTVNALGTLGGNTTFFGGMFNDGRVAPGSSTGLITVAGGYIQASGSILEIEVAGITPVTQHDQLVVSSGTASLDGILQIISQAPNAPGTTVKVLDGNRAGTRFFNVETVAGNGIYFAPEYIATGVNAISYLLGDMNRDGVRDTEDVEWFAKALTNPDAYWNSDATSQGGPACICIYGSSSGNMDGLPGLDFDDVDDFAEAVGVSAARVVEEIERWSVPEPNFIALAGFGIMWANLTGTKRRRRPSTIERTLAI